MAKSNNQKMKILFLLQLFENSQEQEIFPMQKIVELLAEEGIRAERKSIYDDLEVLRQYGLDIRFRKERPSGYYIVKEEQKEPFQDTDISSEKVEIEEKILKEEETVEEEKNIEIEKNTEAVSLDKGFFIPCETGEEKKLKLLCDEKGREEVTRYFGDSGRWKEKEAGKFLTLLLVTPGPAFYGWLTAMGKHVKIHKSKKDAAAYRDYLKGLAKEYKRIARQ